MRISATLSFLIAIGAQSAMGSLVLQSPAQFSGTGLGTVPTILTIQNSGTETGCVGFNGTGASYTGAGLCTGSNGDVKTGASQTTLQALSAASITSASNFALVCNANQPAAGLITLTGITAAFYSSTGQFKYETSGFSCPGVSGCAFPSTFSGTGNSGFVFVLDAAQQMEATAAGAFSSTSNLVGVSFSTSQASGGPETVYLASLGTTGGGHVPEPGSIFLAATGLVFAGSRLIRRNRATR